MRIEDNNASIIGSELQLISDSEKSAYTIEELERVRAEKAAKRGGFEKKILLQEVIEG